MRSGALLAAMICAAGSAAAQPAFEDLSGALPPHVYSGGWEHYVGGGVAVLDCDDDGWPDLFAAGGEAPALLLRNATAAPGAALAFEALEIPPLTGVTGAYPLDMDADGVLDLFVLRAGPNLALRGLGGCRFEDATAAWGIDPGDGWSTAFSATWEPGAERPTLAVGNYVDRDDPEGPFGACDTHRLLRPGPGGLPGGAAGLLASGGLLSLGGSLMTGSAGSNGSTVAVSARSAAAPAFPETASVLGRELPAWATKSAGHGGSALGDKTGSLHFVGAILLDDMKQVIRL